MNRGTVNLPAGDAGTDATIGRMVEVASDARSSVEVRSLRDGLAEFDLGPALYTFLTRRVKFRPDPDGVELIRRPEKMLREIAMQGYAHGDCDDLATLAASVLLAGGKRPAFIVYGRDGGDFQHVAYGVIDDARLLTPHDPQERIPIGEWTPATRRRVYVPW